jgi:hypothetical protein
VGAAADCELIGSGFLGQPVNALTTVAFVVAGIVILTMRPDRTWIGVASIATGLGSFLFHGPMPPGSEWAHDLTLAWLLLTVAIDPLPHRSRWALLGLGVLGVLFAVAPGVADPVAVALALLAIASALRQDRSPSTIGALTLLGVSAVIGRLGATGGALCDPESLLQPHGLWHVSAAAALGWWAVTGTRVR